MFLILQEFSMTYLSVGTYMRCCNSSREEATRQEDSQGVKRSLTHGGS